MAVTLSGMPLRQVEVPVTATNQNGAVGADYSRVPVTLTFGATEVSQTIRVTAVDDSDVDNDGESVQLEFDTLPGGVIAGSQASTTVALVDNDASTVAVNFGAATYEATEGGTAASVVVQLSKEPGADVEIAVTATNQGTTSNADYTGVPVTLTFGASETSKTIPVTAVDDSVDDDGESVQLGFGSPLPTGFSLGSLTTATVNLADTTASVPGVPTGLTATGGDRRVDLSWTAPSDDGDSAITGYRVESRPAEDLTGWRDLVTNTASTATIFQHGSIIDVPPGRSYVYRVSAINSVGTGDASDSAEATTDSASPSAPRNLTVTNAAGSTQIDLSWTAPELTNGADVTGYQVQFISDSGGTWSNLVVDTGGTATTYSYSDTSLAAGAYRLFRVLAINSVGTSLESNVAGFTLPVQVSASWSLIPAGLGAGDSFRLLFISSTKRDSTATTALPYNTFVQDRAADGHADIQAHSAHFRVVGCSSQVDARDNTVTTGPGVPIYWVNGSKAADDYADFYDGDWDNEGNDDDRDEAGTNSVNTSQAAWRPFTGCDDDGTTLHPLGDTPNVRVGRPGGAGGPINSGLDASRTAERPLYGLSPEFTVIAPGTATAPAAITDLTVTASGPTRIDLDWTAPDANGAAISGYRIEVSPNGSSGWTELEADTGSTATAYSHTGLDPGAARHYRVSAINSVGTGPASNVDGATTPYPILTVEFGASAYTATEGGTAAAVAVVLSGMPLREVEIPVTATNQGETAAADYSGVPVTLTIGASTSAVTFEVMATEDDDTESQESVLLAFGMLPEGVSAGSRASTTVRLQDGGAVPGSVRDLAASPGDGRVTLSWRPPASTGGFPITGYAYRFRVPAALFGRWTETGSTDTSVVVEQLAGGQEYIFEVRARNENGWGVSRSQVSVTLGVGGDGICDRTREVQEAILDRLAGVEDCADVTDSHLAGINGELDVSERGIRFLTRHDFDGLVRVEVLRLWGNWLYGFPAGLFRPLLRLRELDLEWNLLPPGSIPYDELEALPRLRRIHITGAEANRPTATVVPTELALRPGGSGRYRVRLEAEPDLTEDGVTIRVESDSANVTVSPESLHFDYENWWRRQEVRVRAGPAEGTAVLKNMLEGFDSWRPSNVVQPSDVSVRVGGSASAGMPEGTPARLVLWTDRLGYAAGERMELHVSRDPMGDERDYVTLFYRQNVATGRREYFAPETGSSALGPARVDQWGDLAGAMRARPVEAGRRLGAWTGAAPEAGLWEFVAELRDPGLERVIKRARAQFVVTGKGLEVVGAGGAAVEITGETRWTRDWIYRLRGPVRVRPGGTLEIEGGTLVEARGAAARIDVDPGGQLFARGRKRAPVVLTCAEAQGRREPGCWGGLAIRGPSAGGALTYVRVEFAGGGQQAAVLLEGLDASFAVEGLQAHASAGNGIEFREGSAGCFYCVASEAGGTGLVWSAGWTGIAQHIYVQQGAGSLTAVGDSPGPTRPGLGPVLSNATLVGAFRPGSAGLRLLSSAAVTARNVVIVGFGEQALDIGGAALDGLFTGAVRVEGLVLHANHQGAGALPPPVQVVEADPQAHNLRREGNPDPRPLAGSAALTSGVAALETDPRAILDGGHAGAFGARNWLEGWTFFGLEADYDTSQPQ